MKKIHLSILILQLVMFILGSMILANYQVVLNSYLWYVCILVYFVIGIRLDFISNKPIRYIFLCLSVINTIFTLFLIFQDSNQDLIFFRMIIFAFLAIYILVATRQKNRT